MKPLARALALLALAAPLSAQTVLHLTLADTIQPISAAYIERGLDAAAQSHASAVLITLDTPGGMLDSTRDIVQHILQSPVPVIVYIAPPGARAGSAGFFLLESADVAAMAPGSNAGAAHPVLEMGKLDDVMKLKVENDAAAFLRSYVSRRNRNPDVAELAVRESKSWSDSEALQLHLIDLTAPNATSLLLALDGRTITRFDGSRVTLRFSGATLLDLPPTLRETLLSRMMDPNLAVLMLFAGALLIYLEFNVPGTIVPGSIGTLLVVAALFALHLLPIHLASLAVLIAAIVLLLLEAKYPSHGALAIAGTVALVFSLLTLVNGPIPEQRVHVSVAIACGLSFGLITAFLAVIALRARRNKLLTGPAALIGLPAVAQTPLAPAPAPTGQILVNGELWQAQLEPAAAPLPAGANVRVLAVNGLTITVRATTNV
jgi:membrane-bound serine protease (ClpP class)